MPTSWKVSMTIIIVCLIASVVIGTIQLASTPDYVFTAPPDGWRGVEAPR